jgi:hypothetical protein
MGTASLYTHCLALACDNILSLVGFLLDLMVDLIVDLMVSPRVDDGKTYQDTGITSHSPSSISAAPSFLLARNSSLGTV